MKLFIAALITGLMLIAGSAAVAVNLQDATGFAAWLSATLPHDSLALLGTFWLTGIAYSTAAGVLYYRRLESRDDKEHYGVVALFGLIGLVISYASFAVIPPMGSLAVLPDALWLLGIIQVVMAVSGIFLPGVVAAACLLALPITDATMALFAWARKISPRKKMDAPGIRFTRWAGRLLGLA